MIEVQAPNTEFFDPALDDPRVFSALQEYQAEVAANRPPDFTEFLRRHAEIADALSGCLKALDFVRAATKQSNPSGPTCRNDLAPGSVLGDFRILREAGRGGMGVVFEAEQISLGRRVALKVLPTAQRLDERQMQRFRNETHAAASLDHPHIVPIYAVSCVAGLHFFAMQYIEGTSLASLLAEISSRGKAESKRAQQTPLGVATTDPRADTPEPLDANQAGPLSLPNGALPRTPAYYREIARIVRDAAQALHHAHQVGVIHRDVKPGNLLLDQRGHVWVADFGLAKLPDSDLTRTGDVVGTLRYMSPEQTLGGMGGLDHRTDVYSLGATLFELLTRQPAFDGEDRQELLHRINHVEARACRQVEAIVPSDLDTIALKALAKEPADRYATAADLADDLQRFLEDQPIHARPPGLVQRTQKWARRNRRPLMASVGVALLFLTSAVIGLAIASRRIQTEQKQTQKASLDLTEVGKMLNEANSELSDKNKELAAALRQARQAEYMYRFLAARREWLSGNIARANDLLAACPHEFRRWEWSYLKNLCRPGLVTLGSPRTSKYSRLAFSSDGTRLIAVGTNAASVYDTTPGGPPAAPLLVVPNTATGGRWVAFSADRSRLYDAGADKQLRVRDGVTGKEISHVPLPEFPAAFTPDGKQLICRGASGVHLVGVPDGKPVTGFRFPASAAGTRAVALTSIIVLARRSGGIELIDPATGHVRAVLPGTADPEGVVAVSPNERLLAVRSGRDSITVWDLNTRKELHVLRGHTALVCDLAFAPDGRRLASVGADRTVRVWDAAAGKELFTFRGHTAIVGQAVFSPDGLRLATADSAGAVILWDATAGQEGRSLPRASRLTLGVTFAADGDQIVRHMLTSGPPRGALAKVYSPATGEETVRAHTPLDAPALPVEGGRGAFLALPDGDARGKWGYWDATGRGPAILAGLTHQLNVAAVSPDGSLLVAASCQSGAVQLIEMATGNRRFLLAGHAYALPNNPKVPPLTYPINLNSYEVMPVYGLAFHPNSLQFASAGHDGTVRVWDVQNGACLRVHRDHRGAVRSIAYHPTGKWLATAGDDGTVRLYDATNGMLDRTLLGAGGPFFAVTFTTDGTRLAAAAVSALHVWDPATAEEYLTIPNPGGVRGLSFNPDGRYLLAGDNLGGAHFWDGADSGPAVRTNRLTGGAAAWYFEQAADAEKHKDWFAAAWHWERLTALDPANDAHRTRLQKARAAQETIR